MTGPTSLQAHRRARTDRPDYAHAALIGVRTQREALAEISRCPAYLPTPLHRMSALASSLGLGEVFVKEEGRRFNMQSFKALGGAYAVAVAVRAWRERAGSGQGAAGLTFCCASDGNHGRSVAFGALHFGAASKVFVHTGVSDARRNAIRELGAEIVVVEGNYDDAVHAAEAAARRNGWKLIADTSAAGGDGAAIDVMRGYSLLIAEACDALSPTGACPFTHVVVQAGVGGLAAAVVGYCADRYGDGAPLAIIVEPEAAACLLESAREGAPARLTGDLETLMAMMSCGEPSPVAWDILHDRVDLFLAVGDEHAADAVRRFAVPMGDDPYLPVGESGAAGLAALLSLQHEADMRTSLGLDCTARVLLIASEAPTDLPTYLSIMGGGGPSTGTATPEV